MSKVYLIMQRLILNINIHGIEYKDIQFNQIYRNAFMHDQIL